MAIIKKGAPQPFWFCGTPFSGVGGPNSALRHLFPDAVQVLLGTAAEEAQVVHTGYELEALLNAAGSILGAGGDDARG